LPEIENVLVDELTQKARGVLQESLADGAVQKLILEETDKRKKTLFSLYFFLGLRNAECCGLEWQDTL